MQTEIFFLEILYNIHTRILHENKNKPKNPQV